MLMSQLKIVAGPGFDRREQRASRPVSPGPWARDPGAQIAAAEPRVAAPPAKTATAPDKAASRQIQAHGVVVDEAGKPVAGGRSWRTPTPIHEARCITDQDGSFTIPIRRPATKTACTLLARTADADRPGSFTTTTMQPGKKPTHRLVSSLKPSSRNHRSRQLTQIKPRSQVPAVEVAGDYPGVRPTQRPAAMAPHGCAFRPTPRSVDLRPEVGPWV